MHQGKEKCQRILYSVFQDGSFWSLSSIISDFKNDLMMHTALVMPFCHFLGRQSEDLVPLIFLVHH